MSVVILQKTVADLVAAWERVEIPGPIKPFEIIWAIKRPGGDRALCGVRFRVDRGGEHSATGEYRDEVWDVGP